MCLSSVRDGFAKPETRTASECLMSSNEIHWLLYMCSVFVMMKCLPHYSVYLLIVLFSALQSIIWRVCCSVSSWSRRWSRRDKLLAWSRHPILGMPVQKVELPVHIARNYMVDTQLLGFWCLHVGLLLILINVALYRLWWPPSIFNDTW